jgi:hypothetical protein
MLSQLVSSFHTNGQLLCSQRNRRVASPRHILLAGSRSSRALRLRLGSGDSSCSAKHETRAPLLDKAFSPTSRRTP